MVLGGRVVIRDLVLATTVPFLFPFLCPNRKTEILICKCCSLKAYSYEHSLFSLIPEEMGFGTILIR
jgi:hypothetical protein